jgi:hypothetical protein
VLVRASCNLQSTFKKKRLVLFLFIDTYRKQREKERKTKRRRRAQCHRTLSASYARLYWSVCLVVVGVGGGGGGVLPKTVSNHCILYSSVQCSVVGGGGGGRYIVWLGGCERQHRRRRCRCRYCGEKHHPFSWQSKRINLRVSCDG